MKNSNLLIGIGLIVVILFFINTGEKQMKKTTGTLYISNNAITSTGTRIVYGTNMEAQEIIPTQDFTLGNIMIYCRKSGAPTAVTIELYDELNGNLLSSGMIDGTTLPTTTEWVEVTMSNAELISGQNYFIVISSVGDGSNNIYLKVDGTLSYPSGRYYTTEDSPTWVDISANYDLLFEVYGSESAQTCPSTICSDSTIDYNEFIQTANFWINE